MFSACDIGAYIMRLEHVMGKGKKFIMNFGLQEIDSVIKFTDVKDRFEVASPKYID